jgi:WhiB family redox-sensing transcriptional regulator
MNGVSAAEPDGFYDDVAAELDVCERTPDVVLREVVTRDGSCMVLYGLALEPQWSGDELTDRKTAALICGPCPVRRECLELELRVSGDTTLGVWGALPAEDVRALHPVWQSRRRGSGAEGGEGA